MSNYDKLTQAEKVDLAKEVDLVLTAAQIRNEQILYAHVCNKFIELKKQAPPPTLVQIAEDLAAESMAEQIALDVDRQILKELLAMEITIPSTGELQKVEESFAMNVYRYWLSTCKTDGLFEEEPPAWGDMPAPIRMNFVEALRSQCLKPIQGYITKLQTDLQQAVSAARSSNFTPPRPASSMKVLCYACSDWPVDGPGKVCEQCKKGMSR